MVKTNTIHNNFASGEVSPKFTQRSDLPVFKAVAEWIENFIALAQGPVTFRTGTQYVHHTRLNRFAVFIPFQYSDIQAYLIEATDQKFRFYKNGGVIVESVKTITDISNTNPAVVTSATHGYSNGDEVFINSVNGMPEINGGSYIVAGVTTNTFQLHDVFGNNVSAVSFGTYTSGGEATRVYELTTPYTEQYLTTLQYAQDADLMYIVNRAFEPRKLIRTSDTNWSIATFSRSSDPFGAGNWPGAITFTSDGSLMYGGTDAKPETIFKSRTPTSTGARYDNFDLGGSSPTASHAAIFKLAPLHGKVDSIRWLSNTDKFVVAGTFGSVRRIYGAREDLPVTPLDINARSVNAYGAANIRPIPNGVNLLYVSRSGNIIRSVEYDYQIDGYQSLDKNLISEHILLPNLTHICNQSGNPEILWGVRSDGRLVGLTYNDKENKYGWHRHNIGRGDVEWIETLPRESNIDQLWVCVKRTIDGQTVRHIEYLSDEPQYPYPLHFFTNKNNETEDNTKYQNVLFEKQKQAIHVDSAVIYDGSLYGSDTGTILTPGSGAITIGASVAFGVSVGSFSFTSDVVGRQLWKKYDASGNGGGRARIDTFIDSATVQCTILSPFDNDNDITPGDWCLTASTVSGVHHLEGEEVTVLNDGALLSPSNLGVYKVVNNGQVSLGKQASVIVLGIPYTGLIQSTQLDQGGQSGPADSKIKNVKQLVFTFLNSLGISFGTDPYHIDKMDFVSTGQITDRPPPLFTGIKFQTYEDTHDRNKHFTIVQDTPFPCTILSVEPYVVTTERG